MKVYELKKGDKYRLSENGMIWTVFQVGRTIRYKPIICVKNDNNTFRVFSPRNKTYQRDVIIVGE